MVPSATSRKRLNPLHCKDPSEKYTVPVKSLETLLFLRFLKEVSYIHQACIYLINNSEKTVIL